MQTPQLKDQALQALIEQFRATSQVRKTLRSAYAGTIDKALDYYQRLQDAEALQPHHDKIRNRLILARYNFGFSERDISFEEEETLSLPDPEDLEKLPKPLRKMADRLSKSIGRNAVLAPSEELAGWWSRTLFTQHFAGFSSEWANSAMRFHARTPHIFTGGDDTLTYAHMQNFEEAFSKYKDHVFVKVQGQILMEDPAVLEPILEEIRFS